MALLEMDQVKIFKDISALKDWMGIVVTKKNIEDFLIPLEALIVTKMMTVSCVI